MYWFGLDIIKSSLAGQPAKRACSYSGENAVELKGSCFCGTVKFEVVTDSDSIELYQCHCSMCRKVTGSTANTAFLISLESVQWVSGQSNIRSYSKPTGYCVDFCSTCGSTVPNVLRNTQYWVPAGLMDEEPKFKIKSHICVESKTEWDEIGGDATQHRGVPLL